MSKLFLFLAAPLALLAVACGSGGDEDQPTPAASPSPTAQAIDVSRDDLGRTVDFKGPAQRVVALSPSVVELMFAVGATPVGRPSSAEYPEAAKAIPAVGTSYQPNFEEITRLNPDLIIADAVIQKDLVNDLAGLGFPVWAVRVNSFDDVVDGLHKVGALVGREDQAKAEAEKLEAQLKGIEDKLPSSGPSVLVIVAGGPTQLFAALDDSYVGDILERLGARNLGSELQETFRLPGFGDYSIERIVEQNPDVIIAISPGRPNITTQALSSSPVWSGLKAVQEGRVHEVSDVVYLQAAGPRVSLILDELSRILYPDVFKAS